MATTMVRLAQMTATLLLMWNKMMTGEFNAPQVYRF